MQTYIFKRMTHEEGKKDFNFVNTFTRQFNRVPVLPFLNELHLFLLLMIVVAKSKSSFTIPEMKMCFSNLSLLQDVLNKTFNEMCNLKFLPEWTPFVILRYKLESNNVTPR